MFKLYNTDSIHIKNIFSVSVEDSEVGHKQYDFGETEFYQLGIKFKGKTKILYNKEYFDYSDETVLFLPCEKDKSITYNKKYLKSGFGICIFFTSNNPLSAKAKIYSAKSMEIKLAFRNILTAFQNNERLETTSIFYHILSLLDKTEENKENDSLYVPALNYIENNLSNSYIEIQHLADLCGISVDHFRHNFRKYFGISPKKYISEQKIKTIKEMLLNSNDNISTIASKTGFYDANYFTRFFKKETGNTPSQYRKSHKKYF
ncbi:MAG: AraC family transcriptional regulator [Clostridiales bacterium]|nr:AraC family transcriptional regulator [Clostridiales bacterium]